jgi:uncharacterized protein YbjT (DUF2867 family)
MFLVTGATGNVGGQVVAQLRAAGAEVRALTRHPATAALPPDVEPVGGDLTRPDTLARALAGVDAAFLFPAPGCGPGFAETARQAGLQRVVLLSSNDIVDGADRQSNAIATFHADIEAALEDSGLAWTFLRPSGFATNTLQWAPQIRATGVVTAPYPNASLAPIHEADIAAVAVRALTTDGHAGARYRLTGPAALTLAEQLAVIGDALGRKLRFEESTPEAARDRMVRHLPPPIVDALLGIFAAATTRPATVLPTVEEVTGAPARTFARWVDDHLVHFR